LPPVRRHLLDRQMLQQPVAGGAEARAVRALPAQLHEALEVVGRQRFRRDQQGRGHADPTDRRQILDRVEPELAEAGRKGREHGGIDQQRAAVGLGVDHRGRPDIAGRPWPVLDHEALFQAGLEAIGHQPGRDVRRPAGRIGDDHRDARTIEVRREGGGCSPSKCAQHGKTSRRQIQGILP